MANEKDIVGKTFLITGGASGLGALFAEKFLKKGAKKVAILDISEEIGEATALRLNALYPNKVIFVKCDVSKENDVEVAFNKVLGEFGRLDVTVNNAGLMNDSPAVWRKSCEVNVIGLIHLTLKSQKHMRKDEGGAGGTIINIASGAAFIKWRELPIYAGTKAAVVHFSLSLSAPPFYEQTGVRVMVACPGVTTTPLLHGLKERVFDDKHGADLEEMLSAYKAQSPDSAAESVVQIFKEGENGSVWMVANDNPPADVTPSLNDYYDSIASSSNPSQD